MKSNAIGSDERQKDFLVETNFPMFGSFALVSVEDSA